MNQSEGCISVLRHYLRRFEIRLDYEYRPINIGYGASIKTDSTLVASRVSLLRQPI